MTNGPTNDTTTDLIEVDEDIGSGYDTNTTGTSDTTSLTSSLQEWLMENGNYGRFFRLWWFILMLI